MRKLPWLVGAAGLLLVGGTLYAIQPKISVAGLEIKSEVEVMTEKLPIDPNLGREMSLTTSPGGSVIHFKDAQKIKEYKFHLQAWDSTILPVTVYGRKYEDPMGFFPIFSTKFKGGKLVGVHREGNAPNIQWTMPNLTTSSDLVKATAPILSSGPGIESAGAAYEEMKVGDGYIRIHMQLSLEIKSQARKQIVVRPAPFIPPNFRTNGSMGTSTQPSQARIPVEIEVYVNTCVGAMPDIVEFHYELIDTWDTSDRNAKVLAQGTLRLKPTRKESKY